MKKVLSFEQRNFSIYRLLSIIVMKWFFILRKIKDKISIFIDDKDGDRSILKVWFEGKEQRATTGELVKQTFLVPFVTLKIISLIHFHAFVLWAKELNILKRRTLGVSTRILLWKT